jgi:hypothetical protein
MISANKLQLPLSLLITASFDFERTIDSFGTLDFSALRIVKIRILLIARTPAFVASKGHNSRMWPRRLRISFDDIITVGDSEVLDIGMNGVKRRIYAFNRRRS